MATLKISHCKYYDSLLSIIDDANVLKLAAWFEKNYVRDNCKYPPEFWAVYDSSKATKEAFPRTQNNVEAWHRRLKVLVGRSHAGLYKIIKDLSEELFAAKAEAERAKNGERLKKKRKSILKSKQMKRILKKRTYLSHIGFLKRISKNIALSSFV